MIGGWALINDGACAELANGGCDSRCALLDGGGDLCTCLYANGVLILFTWRWLLSCSGDSCLLAGDGDIDFLSGAGAGGSGEKLFGGGDEFKERFEGTRVLLTSDRFDEDGGGDI